MDETKAIATVDEEDKGQNTKAIEELRDYGKSAPIGSLATKYGGSEV